MILAPILHIPVESFLKTSALPYVLLELGATDNA